MDLRLERWAILSATLVVTSDPTRVIAPARSLGQLCEVVAQSETTYIAAGHTPSVTYTH
jgi:hypothetical protein